MRPARDCLPAPPTIIRPVPADPSSAIPAAVSTAVDPALASPWFLERIPRTFAQDHGLLSQGGDAEHETLAVTTSTDPLAVWNTATRHERRVVTVKVDQETLQRAIDAA